MANILIVHQNFPGQFPHIADALLSAGHRLAAIGGTTAKARPGIDLRRWTSSRGSTPGILPAATRAEADLIRAEAAAATALALKRDGFTPDLVIGHPGWGETIHLKEIWPDTKLLLFGEYFYRSHGGDVNFDPEFGEDSLATNLRINAKNATQTLAYALADRIVCPTPFQAGTFPALLRDRIAIVHEGIDLSRACRRRQARITLPGGRRLDGSRPVITYVARTLEPLRGFHIFARALPVLLAAVPEAEVLVIGDDARSGYGGAPPGGGTWKSWVLNGLGLDAARVHFLGTVPHATLIDAFSISRAHVYYTYPFVLSWSLAEAMACECAILASDTGPVRDAITDGVDGRLLPFFDVGALSEAMIAACRDPAAIAGLGKAARATALARFDRATVGVPAWLALVDEMLT